MDVGKHFGGAKFGEGDIRIRQDFQRRPADEATSEICTLPQTLSHVVT